MRFSFPTACLAAALFLTGCRGDAGADTRPDGVPAETTTDGAPFTADVPSGWQTEAGPAPGFGGGTTLYMFGDAEPPEAVIAVIHTPRPDGPPDWDALLDGTVQTLRQQDPNLTVDADGEITAGGLAGRERTLTVSMNDRRATVRTVFLIGDAFVYVLSLTAPAEDFIRHEDAFDQVLRSFQPAS